MKPKAFVYTEVQISVPFDNAVWQDLNPILRTQPGLISKTWLAGHGNHSVGGLYAFDSLDNAKRFAQDFFPAAARQADAAFTTRVFDGVAVEEASRQMSSPYFA